MPCVEDGDQTEPAAPAVTAEPAVAKIPQQRGPDMLQPPRPDEPTAPTPTLPDAPPPLPDALPTLPDAPPHPLDAPIAPPMAWPTPSTDPAPLPPAAARRRWPLVSGLVVAAGLVLALIVWIAAQGPSGQTVALPGRGLPVRSGAPAAAAPQTTAGEPTVADKIRGQLAKQAKALLAGDRDGYLAGVAANLRDGYIKRFGSLRAMGVGGWTPNLVDKPSQGADGSWDVIVEYDYCLGQGCTPQSSQVVQTSWSIAGDQVTVTKYTAGTDPWDASALQALTGRRAIVAGSGATASKLQRVLTAADAAADIADRYSHWGPAPKWYIVYVAAPSEWNSWWDNTDLGPFYDGYSKGAQGVVIQSDDAGGSYLKNLLTHELGHVVTIGDTYGSADQWWLTEGIADYISDRDGQTTRGRLPSVRQFVKQGWNGSIALGPPPASAKGQEIDARYGIALLAVTCLAKKYGEGKMLDFFGGVVRNKESLESASTAYLGTAWPGVASACANEIRNA